MLPLALEVGGIGVYEADLQHKGVRFSPELCIILGLPVGTVRSRLHRARLLVRDQLKGIFQQGAS